MAILTGWRRTGWLALVLAALPVAVHAADVPLEYAVKATYLYKFAPFITWPAATFPKPEDAFVLCVNGADEVTRLLPQMAAGQQVNGHPIQVRQLADGGNPQDCQILYIANAPGAPQMLSAAHGKPVLTVIDGPQSGHGIVQFIVEQHHVRFDIDDGLAADGGLSISSKLLGLANAVTPAPQAKP
jgi:hypothetical protein